jgi:HKD family nuclease
LGLEKLLAHEITDRSTITISVDFIKSSNPGER